MTSRTCIKCHEIKPLEAFPQRTDGRYRHECAPCMKAIKAATYAAKKEERREYFRKREALPEVKERHAERNRRTRHEEINRARERRHTAAYRAKYPEKEAAKRAVRLAIKTGSLLRPARCEACDVADQKAVTGRHTIHAHHDDYSRPLDVRWLCVVCHTAYHASISRSKAA